MELIHWTIAVLSTALIICAVFFSVKLSRETRGEHYWLFFVITAVSLLAIHAVRHDWGFWAIDPVTRETAMEVAEITGAFSLAYACFGLYRGMRRVRKRMGEELR